MMKRWRNKNKINKDNEFLQERFTSAHNNILDNNIETISDPVEGLRVIPPEYRGKVTFAKNSMDERERTILRDICATKAFANENESAFYIDHGKCITCGRCKNIGSDVINIESLFSRPVADKMQLREFPSTTDKEEDGDASRSYSRDIIQSNNNNGEKGFDELGKEVQSRVRGLFGRSLSIRTVKAGSCNGCEIEINALLNPIYDIERFGIHFVSSPRHADVLLVSGPVTWNMERPLKLTYEAIPNPKVVIATGACGCSGGIFANSYSVIGGVDKIIPVDVYIPGCPPRPQALLEGILLAISKLTTMVKIR
jgi:Ni,Fe-hydrogenase III small subunit/formate hydrogenlyase subunit 6/NADH:ubiquinone oxidoreductase subunit I